MNDPVATAIREHLRVNDAKQAPVDWSDTAARPVADPGASPDGSGRRAGRGPLVVLAAAALVAVLALAPFVLSGEDSRPDDTLVPVVVPSPPATVRPSTATSLPDAATTIPTPDSARGERFSVDDLAVVNPSALGLLTWTTIEGDSDSLPGALVRAHPDGGFWSWENTGSAGLLWRSDDGLAWRRDEGATPPPIELSPGRSWSTSVLDPLSVYSFDAADGPVEFDLNDLSPWQPPEIAGLVPVASVVVGGPAVGLSVASSNDRLVVSGTSRLTVPWSRYFGTVEIPCTVDNVETTCEEGPDVAWLDDRGAFVLSDHVTGQELDTVEMSVKGSILEFSVFIDEASPHHTFHIVVAKDPDQAEAIAAELTRHRGEAVEFDTLWVIDSAGQALAAGTPWPQDALVLPLPDGFVAFAGVEENGCCGDPEKIEVWTTEDGFDWVNRGLLPFDMQAADELVIWNGTTQVIAEDMNDGHDVWATTDGVEWKRIPKQLETLVDVVEIDQGLGAGDRARQFWASADDGQTWEFVGGPWTEDESMARGARSGWGGFVTDRILVVEQLGDGRRVLAVGTFSNEVSRR